MADRMIAAENLSFVHGARRILHGLSFSIALGPNGAGKTTCLRLLSGYLAASRGKIILNSLEMSPEATLARKDLGYVPEDAPLFDDLSPHEHLKLVQQARGTKVADETALLEQFNLLAAQHQAVRTLSKGFRRRVALAMAFISQPKVLLLDEPGDGLDPNQKRALGETLQRAAQQSAILLSTHQLEDTERFCTRILLLHGGQLRFDGTAAQLKAQSGSLDAAFAQLTREAA
jgi:ABC-2 type transport system ATP-binding protein